jgi:hypothetical protein
MGEGSESEQSTERERVKVRVVARKERGRVRAPKIKGEKKEQELKGHALEMWERGETGDNSVIIRLFYLKVESLIFVHNFTGSENISKERERGLWVWV